VLVATAALFEGGLRVLIFCDHPRIVAATRDLRSPGNFAHRWCTQYWKLQYIFSKRGNQKPSPYIDTILGWRSPRLSQEDHLHKDLVSLGAERPILLYGDSYANRTSWATTWSSLLASSDAGTGHALLNYGVGGYGFDQAFLSFLLTIEPVLELDPVVVMSILLDDDLDRVHLAFRGQPKPHLNLDVKGLDFENDLGKSCAEWLETHPPEVTSYAWRYLLFGSGLVPPSWRLRLDGHRADWRETRIASRRILVELDRALRERELQSFVLVFVGKGELARGAGNSWRQTFLTRELDKLGIPYVSTRRDFEQDRQQTGRDWGDYVADRGERKGHYTIVGNEVSFRALERGLRGDFDGEARAARRERQAR